MDRPVYLDTSALAKLVILEAESAAFLAGFANGPTGSARRSRAGRWGGSSGEGKRRRLLVDAQLNVSPARH